MNKAPFWEGIVVAFLASLIGSIGFFALSHVFSDDFAIRLLISGLLSAYLLYLLRCSHERVGRLTVSLIWLLLLAMLWLFWLPLPLFVAVHAAAVWLLRSLYFYSGLLPSLADLGLNAFGLAAAFWALHHTGSLFLTFWCFFLVQALFVFIPSESQRPHQEKAGLSHNEADFQRAYRAAEAAVRKLSSFD